MSARGEQSLLSLRAAVTHMHQRRELLRDCGAPDWNTWEQSAQAPGRLLVVIDDVDEAVGQSREAAAAIDTLATSPEFVGMHLALATHRPAGAVTPGLRAACRYAVALRAASEADSLGVIGVPDAAMLERVPGRGIVREGVTRAPVHVALPLADRSPRVRRADSDAATGRQLLDVIAARTPQEGSAAPEPSPWSP